MNKSIEKIKARQ